MFTTIAWILWSLVALNALYWLAISFTSGDPGARWLYRIQGLIWLIGIILTAYLPISKFHLIWIFALGGIAPSAIMNWRLQRQMDMGTSPVALAVKKRLEEQSGGEVWSWPEMLRVFEPFESTSPRDFAKRVKGLDGWWVAKEPGVGDVKVIRRVDKVKGTLFYKDSPRFYFCWNPECVTKKSKETSP